MKEDHKPTVQEALGGLKERLRKISEQMRNCLPDGEPEVFAKLYWENETVKKEIQEIQDSINPAGPSGDVGQFTVIASQGPEKRGKTGTIK